MTTCGSTHTLGSMLLSTRAGFRSLTYGSQRSLTSRHWTSLRPVPILVTVGKTSQAVYSGFQQH
jgi:hypothetical protein